MYINRNILIAFLLVSVNFLAISQNSTSSPYSRYGYGELSNNSTVSQLAMGGTSFGLRTKQGINFSNPASYSVTDSTTFLFDMGLSLRGSIYSTTEASTAVLNGNVDYLAVQFPLMRHVGFSAGMFPYSMTGYKYSSTSQLDLNVFPDTVSRTEKFSGKGGLNQVYSGISVDLLKHFSLGVNAYYMFGNINHQSYLSFSDKSNSTSFTSVEKTDSLNVKGTLRFRYAAQFYEQLGNDHLVNVGFVYEPKTYLKTKYVSTLAGVSTTLDPSTSFSIPEFIGLGVLYGFDKRVSLAVDYSLQRWSQVEFMGVLDSLSDSHRVSFGVEVQPSLRGSRYSQKVLYRGGAYLSNPYYKISGVELSPNFGISFGVGLPIRNSNSLVNLTMEYGKLGGTTQLRADFLKLTVSSTFSENWFFKRKL